MNIIKKSHLMTLFSIALILFFIILTSSEALASDKQDAQLNLTEAQLSTNEFDQAWPAISGDKIVYGDSRNGNWDIYMHDLSTGQETQLTADKSDQAWPAISGSRTVWADNRNGNWDIYMYDFSTRA